MNDFVPRIESLPADRSVPPVRPVPAVAPVQAGGTAAQTGNGGQGNVGADSGNQSRRDQMASTLDYAKVQARIANILAEMNADKADASAARANAEAQFQALRPDPTIIIPMPPASLDVIEHAIQVARAMAQEANLTRAAQANVAAGTVSQMMAGASVVA